MSKAFQFANSLKELRIHLCQQSASSSGVRKFIENYYPELKRVNQNTPILIREAKNVAPKLWARYEFGKETHLPLANMNESQVLSAVEKLARKQ
jgi:NADH dehydrogenase (ubiquinone) 1 alpha subcomplex subunit 2